MIILFISSYTSQELHPMRVHYTGHMSLSVSCDQYTAYTPFNFSFTVPLRKKKK